MATRVLEVGRGLDPAGLAAALGRQADELAEFFVPDLRGLDAAAVYEPGSLLVERVEPPDAAGLHRVHFRFAWTAQHGCSDWSCRDTEQQSARFRYRDTGAIFEVTGEPEERSTRDEF